MRCYVSEQLAELLERETCVPRDTTHGERVDRIVAWNGHDTLTVTHDDVLTLSHHAKTGLLERPNGSR
jgi:hypothetical protein